MKDMRKVYNTNDDKLINGMNKDKLLRYDEFLRKVLYKCIKFFFIWYSTKNSVIKGL